MCLLYKNKSFYDKCLSGSIYKSSVISFDDILDEPVISYFDNNPDVYLCFIEFSRAIHPSKLNQLNGNTKDFLDSTQHVKKDTGYTDMHFKKNIASRVHTGNFFALGDFEIVPEKGADFKIRLNCVPKLIGNSLENYINEQDYGVLLNTYNREVNVSAEKEKLSALTPEAVYQLLVNERYTRHNQNGAFTRPLGKVFEIIGMKVLTDCKPQNVKIFYEQEAVPGRDKMDAIIVAKNKYALSELFIKLEKHECISLETSKEFN